MRVLIVRMSSMGDVIHTLPLVADIHNAVPGAQVDWVVEEAYAPLLQLHPRIGRIIPIALRRWRRSWRDPHTWQQWQAFRRALRATPYDAILDTQALLKSAWIASLARGPRIGFVARACREPLAALFYQRRLVYPPVKAVHAIQRYRDLAAFALGYAPGTAPQYGLQVAARRPSGLPAQQAYALVFHSTARAGKLWTEENWIEVCRALAAAGLAVLLAWGTPQERARAERIAAASGANVWVAQTVLDIGDWAAAAAGAAVAVGLDTGLTYLAAAVGAPTVAIYVDSSPAQAGVMAASPHRNLGDIGSPPAAADVIEAAGQLADQAAHRGEPARG